jgi:fructoselysine transporter
VFFAAYGRLHPRHRFPTVALVTMGIITAAGFYISRHLGANSTTPPLIVLIQLLTTVMIIVQSVSQVAAVTVLRKRQPTLNRPYNTFLYLVPSIIALIGWLAVYGYADKNSPGFHPIEW